MGKFIKATQSQNKEKKWLYFSIYSHTNNDYMYTTIKNILSTTAKI